MSDKDFKEIRETLSEIDPEILLADGYEDALIGYVEGFGKGPVAVYDREKCIKILMDRDRMSAEEAVEFFEFNTLGAFAGDRTPAFATILRRKAP